MLRKKMVRDILNNKSQFITILLMITIGVMVYSGILAYMDGMTRTADTYYKENNLQDFNVIGRNLSEKDIDKIRNLDNVSDAEGKLEVIMNDFNNSDKSYSVSFIKSNNISKFYVSEGSSFDSNLHGAYIDAFYAKENNLHVGDEISLKYEDYVFKEKIVGIVYIPDHVYDVKDASQLMPDHKNYGIVYMSINELEDYITKKYQSDNYLDNIPYNYVMVKVNNKDNVEMVRNEIDTHIDNALATVLISDTPSYSMYQSEIDEGKAYVGIFSGLFLFIALLSVITTMTRVVKKQKLQIGALKSLGFSNKKIICHYVGYGLWISLVGVILGNLLGKYFLGTLFLNMEMSFFMMPNGHVYIRPLTYLVSILVVLGVSFITFLTCYKELIKKPADSLREETPKVNNKYLNITTKGLFKYLGFASKWNIRDILRNKFRTITGILGIVGCSTLIVCALGMLNSINYFIKLQFDDIDNFQYKLSLKEDITSDEVSELERVYGTSSSKTYNIEVLMNDEKESNTLFINDSDSYVRNIDENYQYINLTSDEGVYVTYKFKEKYNLEVGDTVKWQVYGSKKNYESKVVGFYRDPQVQGISATKGYIESLNLKYIPDTIYTNQDLSGEKTVKNVSAVQSKKELKDAISSMISMMKEMIILIIVFAIMLGIVIIYNMSILSFSENYIQFATLKVLGFSDKKIRKLFSLQNTYIAIIAIVIGLPTGYYLVSYLFKACLADNYDFGVHIELWTYLAAAVGTYLVSYVVSKYISLKIKKIDMVSSLKANE